MKRASATIAAIVAAQCAAAQSGDGAAPAVRQLLETNVCSACDLRGADLSGASLRMAILNWADLTGADLRDADLTGASLINADLTGADLTGAILTGTDLSGARLDDATVSHVSLRAAVICFTWLPNGQMYLLQQNCP
jgi:uncharacterized protein YjbI with pentapeptide repeats